MGHCGYIAVCNDGNQRWCSITRNVLCWHLSGVCCQLSYVNRIWTVMITVVCVVCVLWSRLNWRQLLASVWVHCANWRIILTTKRLSGPSSKYSSRSVTCVSSSLFTLSIMLQNHKNSHVIECKLLQVVVLLMWIQGSLYCFGHPIIIYAVHRVIMNWPTSVLFFGLKFARWCLVMPATAFSPYLLHIVW